MEETSDNSFQVSGASSQKPRRKPSTTTPLQPHRKGQPELMVSEKVTPELARCYDEIDQIYDYIRGLVPLPPQLRKIRSIDFEQLEARQAAAAAAASQELGEQVRAKPRQRQVHESDQLEAPVNSAPRPIKLTLSSSLQRPAVKRVESLNLGQQRTSGPARLRPELEFLAAQSAQRFRLPRAHSTSTLTQQPAEPLLGRPLPAAAQPPHSPVSNSLGRLRDRLGLGATPKQKPKVGGQLQSIESYIDDEQSSSSSGSNSESSTSQSSDSEPATPESGRAQARPRSTEREAAPATPASSSASSASSSSSTSSSSSSSSSSSASASSGLNHLLAGPTQNGKTPVKLNSCQRSNREHIYEQIPAHKKPNEGQLTPLLSSRQPAAKKSPFNYPVAYTPNVAEQRARPKERLFLATTVPARAPSMHNLGALYMPSAVRLLPAPMRAHLQRQAGGHMGSLRPTLAARPLIDQARHHRLSMSNLQQLMTAHPLLSSNSAGPNRRPFEMSLSRYQRQAKPAPTPTVQTSRAPRFSPAQLIAQIQVPRAVSKRQVQATGVGNLLVWRPAPSANRLERHQSRPTGPAAPAVSNQRQRRLTAIGIEHALARESPEHRSGSYFRLAHEPSSAKVGVLLANRRHPNSISSDLAANSAGSQSSSADLQSKTGNTNSAETSSLSEPEVPLLTRKSEANHDSGNFVSSRSFIKCYYGRERDPEPKATTPSHQPPAVKAPTPTPKSTKRRTSKLLNLIGLNRLAEPKLLERQPRAVESTESAANHDRRQVRHFEHPSVEVAKLPVGRPLPVDQLEPGSCATLASTDTSKSTSSYEAAIKRGAERAAQLSVPAATSATRTTGSSYTRTEKVRNSNPTSSLVRVPKLSRQSHLLNRPLPRPPASSSHRRLSGSGSSPGSNRRPVPEVAIETTPNNRCSGPLPVATNKRASLSPLAVSINNQHQASPTVTTCTSSGISSRMTAATHLAGASTASSLASQARGSRHRVKSLSEIHKQQQAQALSNNSKHHLESAKAADAGAHKRPEAGQPTMISTDDLALMDESASNSPEPSAAPAARSTNNDSSGSKLESAIEPMTELRLFDERFSADRCFADQQLASSSDSLLESINFATLAGRNRRKKHISSGGTNNSNNKTTPTLTTTPTPLPTTQTSAKC